MKFYFGTPGWGWRMFGIGWKTKWFFGLSIRDGDTQGDPKCHKCYGNGLTHASFCPLSGGKQGAQGDAS